MVRVKGITVLYGLVAIGTVGIAASYTNILSGTAIGSSKSEKFINERRQSAEVNSVIDIQPEVSAVQGALTESLADTQRKIENHDLITYFGFEKQSTELEPCIYTLFPMMSTPRRQALAEFAIPPVFVSSSHSQVELTRWGPTDRRRHLRLPSGDQLSVSVSEHAAWPQDFDPRDESVREQVAEVLNWCIADTVHLQWETITGVDERFPYLVYGVETKRGAGQTFSVFVGFDSKIFVTGWLMRPPLNGIPKQDPIDPSEFEAIQKFLTETYERAVVLGVTAHDPSLASEGARQDVVQRLRAEGPEFAQRLRAEAEDLAQRVSGKEFDFSADKPPRRVGGSPSPG